MNLVGMLGAFSQIVSNPFEIRWTEYSVRFLFVFTLLYGAAVVVITTSQKNYRRGVEHGSACWGNVAQVAKRYRDSRHPYRNLILTQHFQMGLDGHRHKRNTNVLVIGGSGAGKSRSYAIPNVLQCAQGPDGGCSILVSDPKAEILRKTGVNADLKL